MFTTNSTTQEEFANPTVQNNPGNQIDLATFTEYLTEIRNQPSWRMRADRESDYCDGNQLDSDVMRALRERGMPPAIEPLIGPTIDSVLGMEVKNRTDWRVIADGDKEGDDVADALNHRLNQAERQSHADTACGEAYASQIKVGIGWVEVARESDPFKYPYRCQSVHRNEIWWDFHRKKPDMSDARYLIRRRWQDRKQAVLMFPDHADLINHTSSGWQSIDPALFSKDGGRSTDLSMAWDIERGWSVEEQEWRDVMHRRVCLFEVWYRVWERVLVLKTPDGRVVEYDEDSEIHLSAVGSGAIVPEWAVVSRVRMSWWIGPHLLHDGPSPYKHSHFPYVPFFGKLEDRTGVPFGLIRGMMYLQDEVNARISKMQWGLAAVRTIRTDGAVLDDDETFRQEIGRPDADIVLDAKAMGQPGATFKVERDFELNRQQYDRLVDAREGIKRTSGVTDSFQGQAPHGISGVAQSGLVEQSNQSLADINDNHKFARQMVGELLISLIIEDMAGKPDVVTIEGHGVKEDRSISLNEPAMDDDGIEYLNNDIERTKLKVTLSDVPSSPSFRTQQLNVMSEAFKSAPPEYQKVMMPYLFALMDVPHKQDIIQAIKEMDAKPNPEQENAKRELDIKEKVADAQIGKLVTEAVTKAIEGIFSATTAAEKIAMIPAVAPLADKLLRSAGFQDKDAAPIVPESEQVIPSAPMPANTNPLTPPNPDVGMQRGIEGGLV